MTTTNQSIDWAKQLRGARAERGHSQRQAAEEIGIPVQTYQTWEQGRRAPRAVLYVKAARRYIRRNSKA